MMFDGGSREAVIVDAHAHLGPVASFRVPDVSTTGMLALMDWLGIDLAVVMHTAGIMECFEEAYEASLAAYEESGGRLPYGLVYHPLYPEESLSFIKKAAGRPGFVCIKIHPGQHQVFPEDERYGPAWRFASELGLPIVTHSWSLSDYNPSQRFATPEHFETCVARYPEVNLVLGHAGGRFEGHRSAARLAQRYANVYLDLSGDVYSFGLIEWLVTQVGAERLLFGSDMNWIDPRTHLGRILDANISTEAKEQILGANACRLFGLNYR